jgi:hypothetical protein
MVMGMIKDCNNCGRERHSNECGRCVIRCFDGNQLTDPSEWIPKEITEPMTALEYMEKQANKHKLNYDREAVRGASEEQLRNIMLKIGYYEKAVEALSSIGEIEFDYNAED